MSMTDPLITYLATHDAPCPGCYANLRGQDEPVCPKCHRYLYLGEIQTWHGVFGEARGNPVGPTRGAIYDQIYRKLETNDFYCPGCGYQLRGLKSRCCPECGRRVLPKKVLASNSNVAAMLGLTISLIAGSVFVAWIVLIST